MPCRLIWANISESSHILASLQKIYCHLFIYLFISCAVPGEIVTSVEDNVITFWLDVAVHSTPCKQEKAKFFISINFCIRIEMHPVRQSVLTVPSTITVAR